MTHLSDGAPEAAMELLDDTRYAVKIAPDVHWVGFFDEEEHLHCNPYLIVTENESILIDPGSVPDFPVVARKVFSVVPPESLTTIILQHQDPDLCASVPLFEDMRENYDLDIYCMTGTAYLIHHYGIKGNIKRLEHGVNEIRTRGGRELKFVWTPYAHSFGAMITYDKASRVLFTSDILGGLGDDWALYHDGQSALDNMRRFTQLIMPSNRVLRHALSLIREIDADLYAPQHGQIIRSDQLPLVMDFLWDMPCGIDVLELKSEKSL